MNRVGSQKIWCYAARKIFVDKIFLVVNQARNGFSTASAALRQQFIDKCVVTLVNDGPDLAIGRYRYKGFAVRLVFQFANELCPGSEWKSAAPLIINHDILRSIANHFGTS
ncbi:MAG: hypothetical protein A2Z90_18205 [Burkholderiales bacterium GWA2_64_37]|nr:MAG: hypothetical protein A2Z90_18205 [Burkholderiales bacterium GWA2_64_37]